MSAVSTTLDVTEEIRIKYIDPAGKVHTIDATAGDSLMSVATCHSVSGIDGDCGGNGACGTCMVQLDPHTMSKLNPPSASERELLDYLGASQSDHRLGCQIKLDQTLQGITVKVASVA
jgi:2Fe-2S ferredoxin